MIKGFKEFILRGNVIDLAVAVVIGAAFTAVVNSIVNNLINPLIGVIFQADSLDTALVIEIPTLSGGVAEAEKRVKAYQDTGVDAIFLAGASKREEVEAMRRASKLPLLLGGSPAELADKSYLATQGVRIALQGHQPFYAAAKAVYDTLKYLREGGSPAGLKDRVASDDLLNVALRQDEYKRRQSRYLR